MAPCAFHVTLAGMAQDYDLDHGFARLRLGLIVLATDESLEGEAARMLHGRDINLLHARIPFAPEVTPATLAQMRVDLPATAALLPNGLDAIGYGCTSGATVIGSRSIARIIGETHPGTAVTDPIRAVEAALAVLGARRIAFVSPYLPEVSAPLRDRLADKGIETLSEVSFGEAEDRKVARISEASTRSAMLAAVRPGVEAIFASCTNLRTFGIIDAVERETGLPVVSSNQALIWHMLRLAGAETGGQGPGRLFET